MTSRQTGQKIGRMYRNQTRYRTGKRTANNRMSDVEKRRLAQFLICGTVFVLLVAFKLVLPTRIQWLSQHVNDTLERSMDVTEVFSAVGRAFTGEEENGWENLYQAVFHPEEANAVPTGAAAGLAVPKMAEAVTARALLDSSDGWLTGRPMKDLPAAQAAAGTPSGEDEKAGPAAGEDAAGASAQNPADTAGDTGATQKLSYILYSNKTLPDNVSLEQKVLGFDYCTPVMGTVSSNFGYREHPIEGEEKFHYGLDIAAAEGTDVGCFADGTVTAVGESSSYGKYAIVAHDNGFSTLYAHCSKITTTSGSTVKAGQKIAEVGQTGEATGYHLHLEIHAGNTYLDPSYYVSLQ